MGLPDVLRRAWTAQERDLKDGQKFQRDVCQCCGYRKPRKDSPECVCDGLDWYMLPGGGVECQAHKFARAIGVGKKIFVMGSK